MGPRVSGLFVYPVKSLAGVAFSESLAQPRGLRNDRRWMVVDSAGRFISQREVPAMAGVTTAVDDNILLIGNAAGPMMEVTVPSSEAPRLRVQVWDDSVIARAGSAAADAWLTRQLGMECRLVYMADDCRREVDPRYAPDHITSFSDGFPLLLANETSLADLNQRLDSPIPMNRFRPNIVLEGEAPFAEDGYGTFRLGEAVFEAVKPCSRCAITTVDQASGVVTGKEPLATLAKFRREKRECYSARTWLFYSQAVSASATCYSPSPHAGTFPLPIDGQLPHEIFIDAADTLHDGYFRLERLTFRTETFGGGTSAPARREVLRMGRAAAILLYDPAMDRIVLIRQFRIGAHLNHVQPSWLLECVAGMIDDGETAEAASRREAVEETGCEVRRMEFIGDYLPSAGTIDEMVSLYIGEIDSATAGGVHGVTGEEDIRTVVLQSEEALKAADAGDVSNMVAQLALLWFARHGEALRRRWLGNCEAGEE